MSKPIIAILPKPSSLENEEERERFINLAYCYAGIRMPIAAVCFKTQVLIVDFRHYDEEERWIIANRLAEAMPIYNGSTSTDIYRAGMGYCLKVRMEGITLMTLEPIPEHVTNVA